MNLFLGFTQQKSHGVHGESHQERDTALKQSRRLHWSFWFPVGEVETPPLSHPFTGVRRNTAKNNRHRSHQPERCHAFGNVCICGYTKFGDWMVLIIFV